MVPITVVGDRNMVRGAAVGAVHGLNCVRLW